jgi:hypothetical protein
VLSRSGRYIALLADEAVFQLARIPAITVVRSESSTTRK